MSCVPPVPCLFPRCAQACQKHNAKNYCEISFKTYAPPLRNSAYHGKSKHRSTLQGGSPWAISKTRKTTSSARQRKPTAKQRVTTRLPTKARLIRSLLMRRKRLPTQVRSEEHTSDLQSRG